MSFNVYKITFVDKVQGTQEEIIHADTEKDARLKFEASKQNIKIVKIMCMPTINELKKDYNLP